MSIDLAAVVLRTIRWKRRQAFALLSYKTQNIGDEIQSVAAGRFLPRIDQYLDREELDSSQRSEIKLILNGWFCHRPDRWPPSAGLRPLLISMHFTNNPESSGMRANEMFADNPHVIRYLADHGPVGARDTFTQAWLESHGIENYYSGCLTLTLDRPDVARSNFIALNDIPEPIAARIAATTKRPVIVTTHADTTTIGTEARMREAERLLDIYARAFCVVTTRLHGALPCLAMNTPVLLIDESWDQSRFAGLNELVHHCTQQDYLSGQYAYDVDDPPANPAKHGSLRDRLKAEVSAFVARR